MNINATGVLFLSSLASAPAGSGRHGRIFLLILGLLWGLIFLPSSGAGAAVLQKIPAERNAGLSQLRPVARMESGERLRLAISLPLRDEAGLQELLRGIYSSPISPMYRRFLTPEQFAGRFCPSEADYEELVGFAHAQGMKITGRHPNRMILEVEAGAAEVEKSFHVRMQVYQHPTEARRFYAPDTDPAIELGLRIKGVSGLSSFAPPRPSLKSSQAVAKLKGNVGSGPFGAYAGSDFRAAYAPGTALTGAGQSVGLVEFDGYKPADITYYEDLFGLPHVPRTNVLLDGFSGAPTGTGGEVEVCLDIQVAIAMAPGISRLIVYQAGPRGNWHGMLNRIATDNLAKQISCSWYSPGMRADPVADQILMQMAAQGQSFFVASGDNDAFTGLIPFPGDTPYATQVGGSTLTTSGPGGAWVSETVWNWGSSIGSGGGISTQYPIPYWQQGIDMNASQGSTQMRNVPDVAMTADNVYTRAIGQDRNVGGTSCAAPLWAAFTALINQQAGISNRPPVGFINPSLYAIGLGAHYASGFHDTTVGNNFTAQSPARYSAVAGYDLCTGLGTPAGDPLIQALAGSLDSLQVSSSVLRVIGAPGGPFLPASATYALLNLGEGPLEWNIGTTQPWLTLSATSGTLAVGGAAAVEVSVNASANALDRADYSCAIWFKNISTGIVQTRQVLLKITPLRPAITSPPEAVGVLANNFQYQVTANYGPTSFGTRGLPANLRLNTSSGLISGTPAVSGTFSVALVASNALGRGTSRLLLTIKTGPTPISQAATGISISVASVRAVVNPNGLPTTAQFEYGTSPTLEGAHSNAAIDIGSGSGPVALIDALTGLAPLTKYYFRVTAANPEGKREGSILSFTTIATPLASTILPGPIQSISESGAALSSNVNPKGAATVVFFQFGPTAAYGSQTPPQEIGSGITGVYAGASLTGLSPGTLYHYRTVTLSALGTFYGPDLTFTTQLGVGLLAVASKNDIAPGITNARFSSFGNPAINDLGHSAFQAFVSAIPGTNSSVAATNNSGIWLQSDQTTLVVRTGEPAPGISGGTFTFLSDPVFDNNDTVAFIGMATSDNLSRSTGIWTSSNGLMKLVAQARTQAPGCPQGAFFSAFPQIALPDQGGVVFVGTLIPGPAGSGGVSRANNQGIWAVDTSGELRLVLRKGDTQQINGIPKVIAGLSIFAPSRFSSQSSSFNSPGDLIFKIRFSDGSQTIEKAVFP